MSNFKVLRVVDEGTDLECGQDMLDAVHDETYNFIEVEDTGTKEVQKLDRADFVPGDTLDFGDAGVHRVTDDGMHNPYLVEVTI